ncbi:MAG: NAD(P)H-hydrate epimerase, partial [Clostridiales bacterium]|nr:NAD(P)H-hydrate epimerase [Clostridiales bacterium]
MKFAVDAKTMKKIDEYTIEEVKLPALVLMERAALETVSLMKGFIKETDRILVVCGIGNNGGDGIATCRILALQGYHVAICILGERKKATEETRLQLEIASNLGIPIENSNKPGEYNIIVDAIFGIGLTRPVTGEYERVINNINDHKCTVVSIDIPSGI